MKFNLASIALRSTVISYIVPWFYQMYIIINNSMLKEVWNIPIWVFPFMCGFGVCALWTLIWCVTPSRWWY